MKAVYIQTGESLNYVNPGEAAIAAGDVVALGTRIGIAGTDIPAGGLGTVHMAGVFAIPKKAGEALAIGAAVYFSTTDGITATASGNTPAGYAAMAAAAPDATARVKLLG